MSDKLQEKYEEKKAKFLSREVFGVKLWMLLAGAVVAIAVFGFGAELVTNFGDSQQ